VVCIIVITVQTRILITYWEKETDKKHDELQSEVIIQNQIKRYDKGLGRGRFTFTFDGYEVTVETS
jgi:hypothetical protein